MNENFLIVDESSLDNLRVLQEKYPASSFTTFYYAKMLQILHPEEFEKKKNEIEAARAEKNVPFYFHIKYVNKHGHLMPKIIVLAHGAGNISLGEACKVMNIKSKYFSAIAKAVML